LKVHNFAIWTILAGCLLLGQGCSAPSVPVTRTLELPYAHCTLTLNDHADDAAFSSCFARIEQVLNTLNMYSPASEVSAVNRAAGSAAVAVTDDFWEVLGEALKLAELTDGRFDPTVGPLVKLWGIGSDHARVPGPEEIRAALRLIGWRKIVLDPRAKTVLLPLKGMTLDFGALLKGYAAVQGGRLLSARGVKSAILDLGGSVLTLGSQRGGVPWRIGLQTPGAPRGTPLGVVLTRDEVVNTSGAYEQFLQAKGRRYQHILDPHTGYPVDSGVEAVSVIAPRLRNADGPTLSIMSLGVTDGMALAKKLGIEVVIIDTDRKLHMSPGVRSRFTLLDSSYSIASR
jgi:FAD:protein FMN transferase